MSEGVRVALVVAVAENGVIGLGGRLPWRVATELKLFRRLTMGKPLVMGRKTFDSIGAPLDGRDMIVVTRNPDFAAAGTHTVGSLDEGLALARQFAGGRGVNEIMVIGGGEIYRAALPVADRVYLSEIHATPEGDTVFPALDKDVWREISRERHAAGPKDSAEFSFVVLDRRRA